MTGPHLDTFRASLNRCLAVPSFLRSFYDLFMASSSEVREKFKNTDFERQPRVLAESLYVMAVAAQGEEESPVWAEMSRLAKLHGRSDRDIRPELYDLWLECLLKAARQHDPQFSSEVEEAWRKTLAVSIEYMRSRY